METILRMGISFSQSYWWLSLREWPSRVEWDMLGSETGEVFQLSKEGTWWLSRNIETVRFNRIVWDFEASQDWVHISAYY